MEGLGLSWDATASSTNLIPHQGATAYSKPDTDIPVHVLKKVIPVKRYLVPWYLVPG